MQSITSFVKRYPQPVFWAIAWATGFYGFYMFTQDGNEMWQFLTFGSFLGGLLVTALADGRGGVKEYLSRIVRWKVGIQWYAAALFLPLLLRAAALGMNLASGARLASNIQIPPAGDLIGDFLIVLLVIALGEEPGFRGFALPRFLTTRTALSAGLWVGVLHMIWHMPLFLSGADSWWVVLIVIAGGVINSWFFVHTRGSVFICMFLHAAVNLSGSVFSSFFTGPDVERQTFWLAMAFVAFAIGLVLVTGRELGRKPEAAVVAPTMEQPEAAG
jgi:membrane protease YdiL (CAAX protease family)